MVGTYYITYFLFNYQEMMKTEEVITVDCIKFQHLICIYFHTCKCSQERGTTKYNNYSTPKAKSYLYIKSN